MNSKSVVQPRASASTKPLVAALIAALGLAPLATIAATISVTSASDPGTASDCTLRQAIVTMNNGSVAGLNEGTCRANAQGTFGSSDTINFSTTASAFPRRGANTIKLYNGQLLITAANLTIDAAANGNVTIDARQASRVMYDSAATGDSLTLNYLTLTNGKVTTVDCDITKAGGGNAANSGGAICIPTAYLSISNSTLSDNSAYYGGGIGSILGNVTLRNSTLSGNSSHYGGGIYGVRAAQRIVLINSTLSGNSALRNSGGNGGGIFQRNGAITLTSSTISANTATNLAGGIFGGLVTATHSIVSGNTQLGSNNVFGSVSGSNNLFEGVANLSPLGNFGGPTKTMVPMAGSVAIDAVAPDTDGKCDGLTQDQRGVARPQGGRCDLGAVESNGDLIFLDGFEPRPSPVVQCSGAADYQNFLIDDFTGSTLSSNWVANANGGNVTVNNGVTLSSSGVQFPFITATGSPIPQGYFSVRWKATFSNPSSRGTGSLVLSNGLPQNGSADDVTLHNADAWENSTSGFTVNARTDASTYNSVFTENPPPNVSHDVEYCWLTSTIEVWVDGTRRLVAPNAGLTRPTALWFGSPANKGSSAPWTSFTLDHVYARGLVQSGGN